MRRITKLIAVLLLASIAAHAQQPSAPMLAGMGNIHYPITTSLPQAQTYFDQGMNLAYGFNHGEAIRSFREAARHDPECAMAYWGEAWALGPNINAPLNEESNARILAALEKAQRYAAGTTEKERDLIEALSQRYTEEFSEDRADLDRAYSEAMRALHERHPEDLEIATMYAESMMNRRPWGYWSKDGVANAGTDVIVSTLEAVLERNPEHIGAIHYYIHAVEASLAPERALAYSNRLGSLAPSSGHLVHMPAHIYLRLGMYDKAVESNQRAIDADQRYIAQCNAQGIYPMMYYPHNIHFLWYAAMMDGRRETALKAAQSLINKVNTGQMPDPGKCTCCRVGGAAVQINLDEIPSDFHAFYQSLLSSRLIALVRFGMWEVILDEAQPPEGLAYFRGVSHFARGMAYAQLGQLSEAVGEYRMLAGMEDSPELEDLYVEFDAANVLVGIASAILAGEIQRANGEIDVALSHFERGVRLEDSLNYMEPPTWTLHVRHYLGEALLEAGRAQEAEAVFAMDLRQHPQNGWALKGMARSQQMLGKEMEAQETEERYRHVWRNADVTLTASRF